MSGQTDARINNKPAKKNTSKPRYLISDLCSFLESYLTQDQIQDVYRAYIFGAEAHEGQTRKTGEPYIYHPLAVARILAGMHMDYKGLMAAILHDVIEDTQIIKGQVVENFGNEVAELVDGVSKLTQINFRSYKEAQAANFRKMLLAMTKDIRIIMIKLADRLHNMRTLGVMRPAKRRRIAKETLEIYAPIANRLGIHSIKNELEELGFAAYWPMRYRILKQSVKRARGNRKEIIKNIQSALQQRIREEGVDGQVMGREKNLYSIYRKMRGKQLIFSEIVDVYAFRIIVDRLDTCYRMLGIVHNLYKPVPGRFKDYIAIPKSNGYQSLHTVLFGPHGIPVEIQIRTEEMHELAESGIAAHWIYKSDGDQNTQAQAEASDWVKNLLEFQQGSGDSMEFLEHVKVDLFPDEVYVFTPRGKIMVLAKGATVIDFAYAVHSDIGNHCVAARVDRHLVPLRSRLFSGQTVEVITSENGHPNPSWLNFVVSGKARANIRNYLKNLQKQEAEELGRRMLEQELKTYKTTFAEINENRIKKVLNDCNFKESRQLFTEIGLGNRMPLFVAQRLMHTGADIEQSNDETESVEQQHRPPLIIKGSEGMVVNFARCCRPIPGDDIIAIFSPGKGIVLHRTECRNKGDFRHSGDHWLDVEWAEVPEGDFTTEIRVEVGNQRGVLAMVASAISSLGSNIENVVMKERDGLTSVLQFVIAVKDRQHLANILRRIRSLKVVLRIARV